MNNIICDKLHLEWANTDPRHYFNKRGYIVILKPSSIGYNQWDASYGEVDCKDTWSISTSFQGYPYITADDKWNADWKWILIPKEIKNEKTTTLETK